MKRMLILLLTSVLLLCGCTQPSDPNETLAPIVPIGQVPKEFEQIVTENLFRYAKAFPDRILSIRVAENGRELCVYDFQGQLQMSYPIDAASSIDKMTYTSDGGLLYVQGGNSSNSAEGVYSLIRKLSASGTLEWEVRADGYTSWSMRYCIERESSYYFFGSLETPETKVPGIVSPDNISIVNVGKDGNILQTKTIGGSDYDSLWQLKEDGDHFILYCCIQSFDGDFSDNTSESAASNWKLVVDEELNILSKAIIEWNEIPKDTVGYLDGKPVTSVDLFPEGFSDGRITSVMDYGDFYLVISENNTAYYPTPPEISSTWYYTETVYGAYDKDGHILWKTAVDSTPYP